MLLNFTQVLLTLLSNYVLASNCDSYPKEIDAAGDDPDLIQKAKEKLLENFGTHYPKESIMGIGVDFETRYTESETVFHDDKTR